VVCNPHLSACGRVECSWCHRSPHGPKQDLEEDSEEDSEEESVEEEGDDIVLFDLDGASGDDWKDGPSVFRRELSVGEFFQDVDKNSELDEIMSFAKRERICMFVPMTINSLDKDPQHP